MRCGTHAPSDRYFKLNFLVSKLPAPKEEELPPWEPSPRETLIADLRTQIQDAGQMEAVVVAAYDATKAKLDDLSDAELKAVASEVSEWET